MIVWLSLRKLFAATSWDIQNIHNGFWAAVFAILTVGLTATAGAATVAAPGLPIIWFAPRNQPPIPAPDFLKLFQQPALWSQAASRVKIFKLYPQFVHSAPDADLKAVFAGLKQLHLDLAIEYGLLDPADPLLCGGKSSICGQVEGFDGWRLAYALARIKTLGGDVKYVAMDEPLWFGTASTQSGAPQASLAAIVQDIAVHVATVHKFFPNAKVGDIEPFPSAGQPANWNKQILEWANAYKAAVGTPLAFFHADVAWHGTSWSGQLKELHALLRAQDVPFGMIYDGDYNNSAIQWTTVAEHMFSSVETDPNAAPDHAILQSWDPQPLYALPETLPGTMTNLVDRYAAAESIITVAATSSGFMGTLTSKGAPVGGAKISAYAIDDGTLNITTTASIQSKVPPDASAAVIALRINTECNCNAPANILLGPAKYSDDTSHATVLRQLTAASQRIVVPAGQTMSFNSTPPIPVTPGDALTFSVPMQVPFSSANSGYVALEFLTKDGTGISRLELPFNPGQRLIGTTTTDMKGQFQFATYAKTTSLASFTFAGNAKLRMSSIVWPSNAPDLLDNIGPFDVPD